MNESGNQKYDNDWTEIVKNVTMFECVCEEINNTSEWVLKDIWQPMNDYEEK